MRFFLKQENNYDRTQFKKETLVKTNSRRGRRERHPGGIISKKAIR